MEENTIMDVIRELLESKQYTKLRQTFAGMNTADMDRIAEAISIIVKEKEAGIPAAKAIVEELTAKYPLN